MSGHGRPKTPPFIGFLAALVFLQTQCAQAQMTDWPVNVAVYDDCELTGLCFVDEKSGWVVGRRGLLLVTRDGGTNWHRYDLGVSCDIEDIQFASPSHGWVAGGFRVPHASKSRGVLFETTDGGITWNPVRGLDLPHIHRLQFLSNGEGLVAGDSTPSRPGGIFKTLDSGRSWTAALDAEVASWQTAARSPSGRVALANRAGQLGHTNELKWSPAQRKSESKSAINDICFVDEELGFAVGDEATVLQSDDGGLSWTTTLLSTAWPETGIDFNVICNQQNRIWIAGNPGGQVYRYDAGQSGWVRFAVPVQSPITKMFFINQQTGWAVSLLGDILRSDDGGENWSVQRRGARGTAVLQIADDPSQFCPELFARYCAEQGFVGGAILLPNGRSINTGSLDDCAQAMGRVGSSFMIAAPRSLAEQTLNPVSSPTDSLRLREYLVRQIRTLQPRAISIAGGRQASDQLDLRGEIMAAIEDATNPTRFPQHQSQLGLPPWQVSKGILLDRSGAGEISISPNEYLPQISCLVGDFAFPSCELLNSFGKRGGNVSFQTLYSSPLVTGQTSSLMDAIERSDSRVPRRRARRTAAGNLVMTRQLAGKQKQMNDLLGSFADSGSVSPDFGNRLANMCSGLDDATAGVWLYELGLELMRRGSTAPARFVFVYLTEQYRYHPLVLPVTLRLYDDFSSAEMTHIARHQLKNTRQQLQAQPIETMGPVENVLPLTRPVRRVQDGVATTVWEPVIVDETALAAPDVQQANLLTEQIERLDSIRQQQAWAVGQSLTILDPTLFDTPVRSLARARLTQAVGTKASPEEQLKLLATVDPKHSIISAAALRELIVIRQGSAVAARRFGTVCSSATSRPWLDGSLDDPVWQNSQNEGSMLKLSSPQNAPGGEILVAADAEFLFLAGTFPCLAGVSCPPLTSARTRNADLSDSDRITIRLDTDRDYQTSFQFSIDSSGQVLDECGIVVAWDPQWFVSSRIDENNWYFEAAIPLAELCEPACSPLWSVAVSRYVRNAQAATWWQSAFADTAAPLAGNRLALMESSPEWETIHPDAWAMIQMPWEPATLESVGSSVSPEERTLPENGATIRQLPAIR